MKEKFELFKSGFQKLIFIITPFQYSKNNRLSKTHGEVVGASLAITPLLKSPEKK